MNNDMADQKLRRLFDGSRGEDARGMPAFDDLASGRRAAPRTAIRWGRVAAAAAVLLVLGAAVTLLGRGGASMPTTHPRQVAVSTTATTSGLFDSAYGQGTTTELTEWAAVSAWRASTDSLLTGSSLPGGSGITAPTDSLIYSNSVSGETDTVSNNGKEAL